MDLGVNLKERRQNCMYMVVGLGNPGAKYVNTRHNIGFDALDAFCSKHDIKLKSSRRFRADTGKGRVGGEKVIAVKPMTYMNLSGEAVLEIADYYDIENENIIVVYDDISMETGRLRIRRKGSAGGHNGIKSIILNLGSDEFPRVKIGVGAPEHKDHDLADYVLGKFSKEETEILIKTVVSAVGAIEEILTANVDSAMNKYNC